MAACASQAGTGSDAPACTPGDTRACYTGPEGTSGQGACKPGTATCGDDGTYGPCEGEVTPKEELCSTKEDDDCDGEINEKDAGCTCEVGATTECYSGPTGTDGVGLCKHGSATCEDGASWGVCNGEVAPKSEDCTNLDDDDCDGVACSAPMWSRMFGAIGNDRAVAAVVDAAGNTYVTGKLTGDADFGGGVVPGLGGDDVFVLKLDPAGTTVWSKTFGDPGAQSSTAIALSPSGNVVLGGWFSGTITFEQQLTAVDVDGFVAELDPDGAPVWSAKFGGAGDDKVLALAVGREGDIVVAGSFNGTHYCGLFGCVTSRGGDDIFLRRFDADHTARWVRAYGDVGDQITTGVALDSGGNILFTGQYQGTFSIGAVELAGALGYSNAFVAKVDPTANVVLWGKGFGDDTASQRSTSIAVDSADQPIIAGTFDGTIELASDHLSAGSSDAFVAKLSEDGEPLWSRAWGNANNQYAQRVAVDAGDNVIVTGGFEGALNFGGGDVTSAGTFDMFLVKLSAVGGHLWSKAFGSDEPQFGLGVATDPTTSQIVITGYATGTIDFGLGPLTATGGEDLVVARLQP